MSTWVLLRGLTRERGHWGAFTDQLVTHLPDVHIVAIDLPGNGEFHRQKSPLCVEDMMESCRTRLETLGVEPPCYLLAMSLGAMLAVAWADAHPGEIAGCVLINTSLRGISPFWRRLRPTSYAPLLRLIAARDDRAVESCILGLTSHTANAAVLDGWIGLRQIHPVSRHNALRQLVAAARFRAPAAAPRVPMLVLCGMADALVHPQCSADLADRWKLPLARHPFAGHDLPLDDGAWVASRIRDWVPEA